MILSDFRRTKNSICLYVKEYWYCICDECYFSFVYLSLWFPPWNKYFLLDWSSMPQGPPLLFPDAFTFQQQLFPSASATFYLQ